MGAHIKDLTGQRFGKLTVLKMLDERKNKMIMYECLCDCGNTAIVSRRYLSRTTDFASCGCNWKNTNWPSDITGLHFGKLTALKPTDKRRQGNIVWECKCDCGNISYVSRDRLVLGSVTSCGCRRKESLSRRQALNLTGQRFGRLVAIRPLEKRKMTNIVWECKCDCGNTVQLAATKLKTGYTKSCGCLQRETVSEKNRSNLAGKRFGKLTALEPTQKRHKENVFPFYCSHCGRKLQRTFGTDEHFYCVTPYWNPDEEQCKSVRWDRTDIEEVVLEALKAQIAVMTLESTAKARNTVSEGKLLRQRLKALTAELEGGDSQKVQSYLDYREGRITREDFINLRAKRDERMEELKCLIAETEAEYEEFLRKENQAKQEQALVKRTSSMHDEALKELMYDAVERINVTDDQNIEIVWKFNDLFASA